MTGYYAVILNDACEDRIFMLLDYVRKEVEM